MYRKLIPAATALLALTSVAALAAPAPSAQTPAPATNTQTNAKASDQHAAQSAAAHQTTRHRAKMHHVRMTVNDDRETNALNRLEGAGYTRFKDVKMEGQNVVADVAKGGKFQHVEVNPVGTITPTT